MNNNLFIYIFLFFTTVTYSNQINDIDKQIDSILNLKNNDYFKKVDLTQQFLDSKSTISAIDKSTYYHNIAKYIYQKKKLEEAIYCLKKGIKIRRKFVKTHPLLLKKSLFNLGFFYSILGKVKLQIKAYNDILKIPIADRYHGKAYQEIGLYYSQIGDFENAIQYLNKAKRIFIKNHKKPRDLFFCHLRLSLLYTKMEIGTDIHSNEYTTETLFHLNKLDSINAANNFKIQRERETKSIYLRKGNAYLSNGDFNNAKIQLEKALKHALKHKSDYSGLANFYNSLGILYLDTNLKNKAKKHLLKALNYANSNVEKIFTYNSLSEFYAKESDYDLAEKMILKSLNLLTNFNSINPSKTTLELLPNKLAIITQLKNNANFYTDKYERLNNKKDLIKSFNYLKIADQLIDLIRLESHENVSKIFWRTHSSKLYMKAVSIAYLLNKKDDMLYFMEKNKALLLLEDISEQRARKSTNIPLTLQIKMANFHTEIEGLKNVLFEKTNSSTYDDIKNSLFSLKKKQQTFIDSIEQVYPKYNQFRKTIKISSNREITNQILRKDQVIISFMLDSVQAYAYFKSIDTTLIYKIDAVKKLRKNLIEITTLIKKPFYKEEEFEYFNQLSHQIYNTLFSKVETHLINKKHLLIIPDDELVYLPFEILEPQINQETTNPNYLLYHNNISYGLSLSHYIQNNNITRNPKKDFLGIALSQFENKNLNELEGSKIEIEQLKSLYNGTFLTNSNATKKAFLSHLKSHTILHIATHANINEQQNARLWLYDKPLNYTELFKVKNQTQLTVLSACKTLQGKYVKGEGLMSLARGFLKSGSNSVVSSLWNVNDKSNSEIVVNFYQNLAQKMRKDLALTKAKKTYIDTHYGSQISPYYWSSSILIGDSTEISFSKKNNNIIYYILVFGLVLSLFFYFKIKK